MSPPKQLARREREIMEIVYQRQQVSVDELCNALPGNPTPMAVRRMLAILVEKEQLTRSKEGRRYLYRPKRSRKRAGRAAFRQVLKTFFDGSVKAALATHLENPGSTLTDDEVEELSELIAQLKRERGEK